MANESRLGRARRALLCALWLLGLTLPARAVERGPVLLLEPPALDGLGREALSRLEGELRGAAFVVIRRELPAQDDPPEALERESRQQLSSFACTVDAQGSLLRFWLYDGVAHRLSVQHWQGDDPHAASVLAVQGVELVRARLAAPEAPFSDAPQAPAAPPARSAPHLGFALGVGSLYEPAAHAGSYLPLARVFVADRLTLGSAELGWAVRLGAGALGAGTTLQAPAGRARVVPSLLLVDALLSALPDAPLTPFLTLGGGMSQLHVEGSAEPGFYARASDSRSLLAGAGLGLLAHPFAQLGLQLEAQGWLAAHPTRVRVDAEQLASFGQPSLLLSALLVLVP